MSIAVLLNELFTKKTDDSKHVITPENHPDFVAVIEGEGQSAALLAARTRELLESPQTSAVVIFPAQQKLSETFALASKNASTSYQGSYAFVGNTYYHFASQKTDTREEILAQYGPDYVEFSAFLSDLGAGEISLRAEDGGNAGAHLDSAYSYTTYEEALQNNGFRNSLKNVGIVQQAAEEKSFPAGVTATMAVCGGGTEIIDAPKTEFTQQPRERDGQAQWYWTPSVSPIPERLVWSVPNGAYVVMKSKGWTEEGHYPCAHRSPPRKEDGNASERNVAVGFLFGKK